MLDHGFLAAVADPAAARAAVKAARLAIRAASEQWGSTGPQAVVDALEKLAVDRFRDLLHK